MTEVALTDLARVKIEELREQGKVKERALQLTLVRTHCMGGRGYTYGLEPDPAAQPGDGAGGLVTVAIRPQDAPLLEGSTIDYTDGLQRGFSVNNPHAVGKCPCGRHDLLE